MKTRRVFITLEVETDVPIAQLRRTRTWLNLTSLAGRSGGEMIVHQVQANVSKPKAKTRRARS